MWLKAELFEDGDDETPVASATADGVTAENLAGELCEPVRYQLQQQLQRRALDGRLAKLVPELCAALFPHEDVPTRKAEGLFGWTETSRKSVLVMLRGEFAGQWTDFVTGQHGGPFDLVAAVAADGSIAPDHWVKQFLQAQEKAQAAPEPKPAEPKAPEPAKPADDGKKANGAPQAERTSKGGGQSGQLSELERARRARAEVDGLGQPAGGADGPAAA